MPDPVASLRSHLGLLGAELDHRQRVPLQLDLLSTRQHLVGIDRESSVGGRGRRLGEGRGVPRGMREARREARARARLASSFPRSPYVLARSPFAPSALPKREERSAHQPVPSAEARGALDDALEAQQAALGALVADDQDARVARQRAQADRRRLVLLRARRRRAALHQRVRLGELQRLAGRPRREGGLQRLHPVCASQASAGSMRAPLLCALSCCVETLGQSNVGARGLRARD